MCDSGHDITKSNAEAAASGTDGETKAKTIMKKVFLVISNFE